MGLALYAREAASDIQGVAIEGAATGITALVAAVTGKRIIVVCAILSISGASTQTAQFKSGTTALTGALSCVKDRTLVYPYSASGYFRTAKGEGLNLVVGAAAGTTVEGVLQYIVI